MVLGSISIFIVGLPGITSYLRLLRFYGTTESGFGSYPQYMHNLRALLQYYAPFSYARYAWVALIIPITISTMWLNASAADEERSTVALWVGNFLAMMLLTPHLYAHDLTLMIVPSCFNFKNVGWLDSLVYSIVVYFHRCFSNFVVRYWTQDTASGTHDLSRRLLTVYLDRLEDK